MSALVRLVTAVRSRPDRPFVIAFGHLLAVLLYVTGTAVSHIPFRPGATKPLVSSDLIPALHAAALILLLLAMWRPSLRGVIAGYSTAVWTFTTVALYFLAHNRTPPLALWAPAFSLVITLAAFLMFVRWGTDDEPKGR